MSPARGLALALLTVSAVACDACQRRDAVIDAGAGHTSARTARRSVDEGRLTPRERAEAYARSAPEARERSQRRAVLLADARRLTGSGQHQGALRALEDAIDSTEGPDAELHCEAARRAIELGRWSVAREHLRAGLSAAVQPRRRAACLFDRARVEEESGQARAAIATLGESLALRSNGTVARRIEALRQALAENGAEPAEATPAADPDSPLGGPFASLEALCARVTCTEGEDVPEPPPPPAGWDGVAELAIVTVAPEGAPLARTWLVAEEGDEWRAVAPLAATDSRDVYGALEAREVITAVRAEGDQLTVAIAGAFDEHEDEGRAYFECAAENDDDEATMACFDRRTAALPPPDSWTRTLTFGMNDGRLGLLARGAGTATQH